MYVVFLGPEVGGNLCAGEGGLHEGGRPWGEAESHSDGYRYGLLQISTFLHFVGAIE